MAAVFGDYPRGTGGWGNNGTPATGRPVKRMDLESAQISGRPRDWSGCAL